MSPLVVRPIVTTSESEQMPERIFRAVAEAVPLETVLYTPHRSGTRVIAGIPDLKFILCGALGGEDLGKVQVEKVYVAPEQPIIGLCETQLSLQMWVLVPNGAVVTPSPSAFASFTPGIPQLQKLPISTSRMHLFRFSNRIRVPLYNPFTVPPAPRQHTSV